MNKILNYADRIHCPVVAIHGKNDPHIVDGVKVPLESRLSNFEMYVLEKCGHEPWKEYYAKDKFFEILKKELVALVFIYENFLCNQCDMIEPFFCNLLASTIS